MPKSVCRSWEPLQLPRLLTVILTVGLAVLSVAEPGAAQPVNCETEPMNRELDFWIGDWDVYANGQLAGRNRIEPTLDGCALTERWTSARGSSGVSLNWVDRSTEATPRWRQLWVDASGQTLDYTHGEYSDGAMRFQGRTLGEEGEPVLQRLVFVNVAPDTVRQQFSSSRDNGESWEPGWEGLYVRRTSSAELLRDSAYQARCQDAAQVLEKSRERHDPDGRWTSTSLAVHIQEPRLETPLRYSEVVMDNRSGSFRLTREHGSDVLERIIDANGSATTLLNGTAEIPEAVREQYRIDDGRNYGLRSFYRMIYGLPMSLSHEVVERVRGVVAGSFAGREVCKVRLDLKEGVISRHWELMVDPVDYSLVALRFEHPDDPALPDELIVFDGEFTWDEMRIPRFRHWYLLESDEYLGSDVILRAVGG